MIPPTGLNGDVYPAYQCFDVKFEFELFEFQFFEFEFVLDQV